MSKGEIECYISKGHTDAIYCLQAIDGFLYTASGDHTLRKWSVATGELEEVWSGHTGPVTTMKYSDGKILS